MYEYRAEVIRVVDGDTVDVLIDCGFSTFRKERVRLHGIDAPESRTRDKKEKVRGLAAKARLQELIKNTSKKIIIKKMYPVGVCFVKNDSSKIIGKRNQ